MLVPSIFSSSFNDGFFDDFFNLPFVENSNHISGLMNADVEEFDNKYQLSLELPGYAKDDIHADLQDGYLTIQAERHENKDEKDKKGKFIRRERYSGQCQRSFYVGENVKQEDIHARFENGILKIEVPKVEKQEEVEQKNNIMIE